MKLHAKQLEHHLKRETLLPVYLINGDSPLLAQEIRDVIRKTASKKGFYQHELFFINNNFNWEQFSNTANNFSLFSEKTFLEIRNAKGNFNEIGTKTLLHYLDNIPDDKLLLIVTGKLTTAQQKTKWFKTVESIGAIITIWPVNRHELPHWIAKRLQGANLKADTESIHLLADLTEGNLLATQQAIEKLQLLYPTTLITAKEMTEVINDNTHFNVFDLTNYALAGSQKQTLRVLSSLRATGTEAILVLWSLTRELRQLYSLAQQLNDGATMTQVLSTQWQSRKALLKTALSRLTCHQLNALLQQAQQVDLIIKGVKMGEPWLSLEDLCLAFTSTRYATKL